MGSSAKEIASSSLFHVIASDTTVTSTINMRLKTASS
ncbi:hypothetical protein PF003_g17038 [Phytophthora fragariae]|nr:hypothetical protein PF003_g17038 [Phytophthora fragariae]